MGTALTTDLYELTMAQSYLEHEKTGNSVFSLFARTLPEERNFLVVCGLDTLVGQLKAFRFSSDDLAYLSGLDVFSDHFLSWLKSYRFNANLFAIPEGTIVFENEPLVQIEGSLPEVQILETLVLNSIQYQTLVASKAARIMSVNRGKPVVDFGFRRSHMAEAGIYAARAGYIAGFSGTSNLEAGKRFGIPVVGTMAHSYVMVFSCEEESFRSFASSFPDRTLFLLDTYDTRGCIEKVVRLVKEGVPLIGVRLDSGDIDKLAREIRQILDDAGLVTVKIFVSSGVDEYAIRRWLDAGVPLDSFGVGTKFITSSDAPFLDMVYKLVEYEGRPVYKTSPGKITFPYKRQVVRHYTNGLISYDEVIHMSEEVKCSGLVVEIMREGDCLEPLPSLDTIKKRMASEFRTLPQKFRSLEKVDYRVIVR
ncbi:MAG: putative nicotinate phosphoribosyltransferase [Methanoregula sp. PtaU1.Bin051]|nr:MAG: putative nicotinate phosphoribosyltransferase [Methanoregula sp. PtaU1.Bin051]